jgi:ribosomal-protein-serine acetyltransferase
MINAGDIVLKRWEPSWATAGAEAVVESLPELKPFMPWATDAYQIQEMADFIDRSVTDWAEGTQFNYAVFTAVGDLIGAIGLMDRMGPGILEIGYWMRSAYAGRGHMTAAVQALARVALTLPGIDRVAIQYDAANAASAAVAAKAGFTETGRLAKEPEAPGESGTHIITERRA